MQKINVSARTKLNTTHTMGANLLLYLAQDAIAQISKHIIAYNFSDIGATIMCAYPPNINIAAIVFIVVLYRHGQLLLLYTT